MNPDRNKINFFTGDPIDQIVYQDTISIVNDGVTTNAQESKIVTQNIANPYGKKALVRFVYSVDGTNFNGEDAHLVYTYSFTISSIPITQTLGGLRAAVSVGVSDTEIKFRTANGYHTNVNKVNPGDPDNHTGISQTFTIKYSIFEVGI